MIKSLFEFFDAKKRSTMVFAFLSLLSLSSLHCTSNRNIRWTANSCWIDSGLQCMTSLTKFNETLNLESLKINTLEEKLRFVLQELKKPLNLGKVDVQDLYQTAVQHNIGAMGTGGGDFVPQIINYLVTNPLPHFKKFFRLIIQRQHPDKVIKNEKVTQAEKACSEIDKKYRPLIQQAPILSEQRKNLAEQRENDKIPFQQIIAEETKKLSVFDYRAFYYTTISGASIDQIIQAPSSQEPTIITAPTYLLLQLANLTGETPLKIKPYFSSYFYTLKAKGLTTSIHATCIAQNDSGEWFFYDDMGDTIKQVSEDDVKQVLYGGKKSDFLYYEQSKNNLPYDENSPFALLNFTPLHWAVLNENKLIVEKLIQAGANTNEQTISGETPLHFAALVGSTNIIAQLLERGGKVNAINNIGKTPLHYAVQELNTQAAKMLLTHRANVNAVYEKHIDQTGYSPLNIAIQKTTTQNANASLKLIKILLSFGADKNIKSTNDRNAYAECNLLNNDDLKEKIKRLLDTINQKNFPNSQQTPQRNEEVLEQKYQENTLHKNLDSLHQSLANLRTKLSQLKSCLKKLKYGLNKKQSFIK